MTETYQHDKGMDCRRADEVLDNYRHRAIRAEFALLCATTILNPETTTAEKDKAYLRLIRMTKGDEAAEQVRAKQIARRKEGS